MELIFFTRQQDLFWTNLVSMFCSSNFHFGRDFKNQRWFIVLLDFQQTEAFMLVTSLVSFTLKGKHHWNNIPEIGDICFIWIKIEKIVAPKLIFFETSFNIKTFLLFTERRSTTTCSICTLCWHPSFSPIITHLKISPFQLSYYTYLLAHIYTYLHAIHTALESACFWQLLYVNIRIQAKSKK